MKKKKDREQMEDPSATGEALDVKHRRGATLLGASHTDGSGRNSSADFEADGRVMVSTEGRPRQGEQGTLRVIEILAAKLLDLGMISEPPIQFLTKGLQEPNDAVALGRNGEAILAVQVARAGSGFALEGLGRVGKFSDEADTQVLARHLLDAVEQKCSPSLYAPAAVRSLVLALDALDHQAVLASEPVVTVARNLITPISARIPFASVWVVGPTEALELWRRP